MCENGKDARLEGTRAGTNVPACLLLPVRFYMAIMQPIRE